MIELFSIKLSKRSWESNCVSSRQEMDGVESREMNTRPDEAICIGRSERKTVRSTQYAREGGKGRERYILDGGGGTGGRGEAEGVWARQP